MDTSNPSKSPSPYLVSLNLPENQWIIRWILIAMRFHSTGALTNKTLSEIGSMYLEPIGSRFVTDRATQVTYIEFPDQATFMYFQLKYRDQKQFD